MNLKRFIFSLSVLTLTCVAFTAFADVAVDPSYYTGSRQTDTPNGVTATENWSSATGTGFKISWSISQLGNGNFHYIYTITNASNKELAKDMSHFILQVSDTITASNVAANIFKNTPSFLGPTKYTSTSNGNSNPGMPNPGVYGLKFDATGSLPTITFDSTRAPVWGDFYTKDGKNKGNDVFAYNSGFGILPTSANTNNFTDFTKWIPRPDTTVAVPEPATLLILGSSLAMAAFARKTKKVV